MNHHEPPCTISPRIVDLVEKIGEALGRLSATTASERDLRLRRLNRIRSIRGSLAIEGNTLGEDDITALIDGKRVIAPATDLLEAKNAIKVYERFDDWNPKSEKDLLAAHKMLMDGLAEDGGKYRAGGVGVVSGEDVVHMAPSAGQVTKLMSDLFIWMVKTDQHPLIASSIFHYEFEFIHPFSDGNGRMGRLWQSLFLTQWNSIFSSQPVESLIFENQELYYRAIQDSTNGADSRPFVEFLLRMILEAFDPTPQVTPEETPQVRSLLRLLDRAYSRAELMEKLGLRDAKSFRNSYLKPAIAAGWVERTIPDKPNSRHQRYRITSSGEKVRDTAG